MQPKWAPITGTGDLLPGNIPRNVDTVAGYVFDLQAQEQTFCDSLPADTRDDFTRFCIGYKLSNVLHHRVGHFSLARLTRVTTL